MKIPYNPSRNEIQKLYLTGHLNDLESYGICVLDAGPPTPVTDCVCEVLPRFGLKPPFSNPLERFRQIYPPIVGTLVVYFDGNRGVHFGVLEFLTNETPVVLSRWGPGGPLIRHPLTSVPTRYGDRVRFYVLKK